MTVQELIEELKRCPPHMIVVISQHKIIDGPKYIGDSKILLTSHVEND